MGENSRALRVVVSVNGTLFRIPCPRIDFTVRDLNADVERRYERYAELDAGSCSVAEIRGPDGSVLDESDPIRDLVDDMERLTAVLSRVQSTVSSPKLKERSFDQDATGPDSDGKEGGLHGAVGSMTRDLNPDRTLVTGSMPGASRGGLLSVAPLERRQSYDRLSPVGERLADGEEVLDSWASARLQTIATDGHTNGVTSVWFNGALAVTGGRDRLVKVWDIGGHPRPQAGSMNVASLEGHETNVRCVAMQAGLIVSGGGPNVRVWDATTFKQAQKPTRCCRNTGILRGHEHYVSSLDLDSERRLITGSWDKTVRVWKLPADGVHTEATLVLKEHTSSILAMQRSSDRLVTGSLGGEVLVWNLIAEKCAMKLPTQGSAVNALAWDRSIIMAATDTDIQVLDSTTGKKTETLRGHSDVVTCMCLAMPYLITGSRDNTVKVWSTRTWRCLRTISARGVRALAVHGDNMMVGSDAGELQYWATRAQTPI